MKGLKGKGGWVDVGTQMDGSRTWDNETSKENEEKVREEIRRREERCRPSLDSN